MKKVLLLLFVAITTISFSQESITEGVVFSKQTMSTDNAQIQSQLAMIGDILTTTYFKGNKTRSETSNMMTGSSFSIMDNDSKQMLIAMNNQIGKKYAVNSMEPSEEDLKNITIAKGDETKNVLGYDCQEYNIEVNKDGVIVKMDVYTTDKLSAISQQSTMLGAELNGYPLYMTMDMNQSGMNLTVTHEVTEIKKESVSDDKFDMTPPEGYEKTDKLQGM
ncbi:hypothetical protein [Formosa maritima]|uniref:DUF4412 domain-containing protein n=1 Tax=Formosa maritima TaxID=2592046 RepID=A0A5D0GLF1_9FLAO|nr:hypothetical protein [Formosa maritima]TYA59661.1 hypothetical protein FVF61_01005 [Formosa maritima]